MVKTPLLLLKIFFTAGLLFVVGVRVDFTHLLKLTKSADVQYILYAFLIFVVMQLLTVLRWKVLLESNGLNISAKRLAYIQFVGLFFRYLLPTSIGEEVVKIAKVNKTSGNLSKVVISALYARGIGIIVMLGVASVSMVFTYQVFTINEIRWFLGGLGTIALIVCFVVGLTFFPGHLKPHNLLYRITVTSRLMVVYDYIKNFCFAARPLALASVASLFIYSSSTIATYSIALGFHLDIPIKYCFSFLGLISLVTLLPITVNGIGIREGAFIYLFSRLGASSTEIVLLPLTAYLLVAVLGVIGGIGYLLENILVARSSVVKRHAEGS